MTRRFVLVAWLWVVVGLVVACASLRAPIRRVARLGTGAAYDVQVAGDYAYVTNNEGVAIIDIAQRSQPRRVATIELGEAGFGMEVRDGYAYVAGGTNGFTIADVRDPTTPAILGTYPSRGAQDVCLGEGVAYVGLGNGTLEILAIADPTAPALLGRYVGEGMGMTVACRGDLVYFGVAQLGLVVLDASDPAAPARIGIVGQTQGAKDVRVVGEHLYLGCHANGARIVDIADPRAPEVVASFSHTGEAWGASGDESWLWIADLHEGVELYDVSETDAPHLVARADHYAPHKILYDGMYAYLADQDKGLVILRYAGGD